jgi:hypothetical protein
VVVVSGAVVWVVVPELELVVVLSELELVVLLVVEVEVVVLLLVEVCEPGRIAASATAPAIPETPTADVTVLTRDLLRRRSRSGCSVMTASVPGAAFCGHLRLSAAPMSEGLGAG